MSVRYTVSWRVEVGSKSWHGTGEKVWLELDGMKHTLKKKGARWEPEQVYTGEFP
ncbi:MAG: hypothetical protein ACI9K2_004262 [Myxococcota bacterium]|jgi:hypothetical protein